MSVLWETKETFDRVETLKVKKVEYSLLAYHEIQTNERVTADLLLTYKPTAFFVLHPSHFWKLQDNIKTNKESAKKIFTQGKKLKEKGKC